MPASYRFRGNSTNESHPVPASIRIEPGFNTAGQLIGAAELACARPVSGRASSNTAANVRRGSFDHRKRQRIVRKVQVGTVSRHPQWLDLAPPDALLAFAVIPLVHDPYAGTVLSNIEGRMIACTFARPPSVDKGRNGSAGRQLLVAPHCFALFPHARRGRASIATDQGNAFLGVYTGFAGQGAGCGVAIGHDTPLVHRCIDQCCSDAPPVID